MLDDLESTLSRELREVAADLRVPPAPTMPPLGRTPGRRRWQPALAAASVVLVVAVAVAVAMSQGGRDPDPAPPSPSPTRTAQTPVPRTAPQVPYVLGGGLFVDGESLPGIWSSVWSGPQGWLAQRTDGSWWRGTGPEPVPIEPELATPPVLSPSGRYVAWAVTDRGRVVLNSFDAGSGAGSQGSGLTVDPASGEDAGSIRIRAVTDDGRVVAQGPETGVLWRSAEDVAPVDLTATAPGQQVLGSTGVGLVVTDGAGGVVDGTTGEPYLAQLADDGTLTPLADLPTHDDLLLSPGGTWLLRTPPGTTGGEVTAVATLEARSLDGERRTTLTPPDGWEFRVRAWAWEDDQYVVAPVVPAGAEPGDDSGESVVRCGVSAGRCVFVDLR